MRKVVSRSSTDELEKLIDELSIEVGQTKAEIYRRAHALYIGNEKRKRKIYEEK